MDIKILKHGDKVLVECTVQAEFANSKMVMVTTRDCTEGFDAYVDEIQEPKTGHWKDEFPLIDAYADSKVNEVLDKIRAEIERQEKWLMDAGYNQYNVDIALDTIKSVVDKYKAKTEAEDGNDEI